MIPPGGGAVYEGCRKNRTRATRGRTHRGVPAGLVCGPIGRLRAEAAFERAKNALLQAGDVIGVDVGYSEL